MNSMKFSTNPNDGISNKHLDNVELATDFEEDDDDAENLHMAITPALSGSALRALLSQLRRKCKMFDFKCKQQRKYILNIQNQINLNKNEISNQKIKICNSEQNILMLQNENDISNLEYLRGAELHQTRQELVFILQGNVTLHWGYI